MKLDVWWGLSRRFSSGLRRFKLPKEASEVNAVILAF
jgi:hypothetical protein